MNWLEQIEQLLHQKEWDIAIEYMEITINSDANNPNAYINLFYILMNLLVEEEYEKSKHDYYVSLCKKYFHASYIKFSQHASYLYYTGKVTGICPWYFDVDIELPTQMIERALQIEPDNLIYQWPNYSIKSRTDPQNKQLKHYINITLDSNYFIHKELSSKGPVGNYILRMMMYWAIKIRKAYYENEMARNTEKT